MTAISMIRAAFRQLLAAAGISSDAHLLPAHDRFA